MGSWIQLFRSFFADEMWRERRRYSRAEAWLDILGMRAYGMTDVKMGRCQQAIGKNECAVSVRYLAMRWGWSEKMVRSYIKYLTDRGLIETRTSNAATIIKVLRVDTEGTQNGTPKGTPNTDENQCVNDTEGTQNGTPNGTHEIEDNIYNIISLSTARTYSINTNNSNTREGIDAEVGYMATSRLWRETTCMMFKISDDDLSRYLEEFRLHCKVGGMESHTDINDARKHFRDWLTHKIRNNGTGHDRRTSAEYIADAQRRGIEEAEQFVRAAKARRGEIQDPATG